MIVKGGGAAASIILIIVQGERGLKLRDTIKERVHKIAFPNPHEMRKAIFSKYNGVSPVRPDAYPGAHLRCSQGKNEK